MARSRVQRRSRLQEERIAAELEGKVQAGSGNSWRAKGDVRVQGEWRVEAKYTEKSTYPLRLSSLQKIADEALKGGLEEPVLQLEFVGGVKRKYAIIRANLFKAWMLGRRFKPIAKVSFGIIDKSVTLRQDELLSFTATAISRGQMFALHLAWVNENVEYYLLNWDDFLYARAQE